MSALSIVQVHPDLLGTYGDGGNALVLRHRASLRGIEAEVIEVGLGDPVPASADIYLIGGGEDDGQLRSIELLRGDLGLRAAARRGAPILAVCAGLQMLGESFEHSDGRVIAGLGLLDARSGRMGQRAVGDVVADWSVDGVPRPPLIGFANHRGSTVLGTDARPLARVRRGVGNIADGDGEGAVQGSIRGTYLHGPVLALNPTLADELLVSVVGALAPIDDAREEAFRAARLTRALHMKGT